MPIVTTYTIKNTQGTLSFTINAGAANGPNETTKSTDLTFYGYSRTSWGQEVDQNFYRLLENFACVQNGSDIKPSSKVELGSTNGINKPVIGQLWFNKTNNELYSCINATVPTTPARWKHIISEDAADDKYALITSLTGANEPLLLSGANSPMTGMLTLDNVTPSSDNHATRKKYVDDQINATESSILSTVNGLYVALAGDNMTGGLSTAGGIAITGSSVPGFVSTAQPFIQATISGLNARFELGTTNGTGTTPYIDFHSSGNNIDYDCRIISSGGSTNGQGTLTLIGFIVDDGRTPTLGNQLVHKSWVDTQISTAITGIGAGNYLLKSGGTMTGEIKMGGNLISNVGWPTAATDAATPSWVRGSGAYGQSGWGGKQITISTGNPSGGNNGDIWFKV